MRYLPGLAMGILAGIALCGLICEEYNIEMRWQPPLIFEAVEPAEAPEAPEPVEAAFEEPLEAFELPPEVPPQSVEDDCPDGG